MTNEFFTVMTEFQPIKTLQSEFDALKADRDMWRDACKRAEDNALGWEKKNAQNVGIYEREADALRAKLASVMLRLQAIAGDIDAALGESK